MQVDNALNDSFLEKPHLAGQRLKIKIFPDPILKKKALPVEKFDVELIKLCQNMLYTMYQAPGIGLAAPQIGQSLRLLVMDVDYKRELVTRSDASQDYDYHSLNPHIFINPVILEKQGSLIYQEGCLSLPGVYEDVQRAESIQVKYQDWHGQEHTMQADGLFSICLQHEMDHLEGIVFLDYLSPLKREFFRKKLLKLKRRR